MKNPSGTASAPFRASAHFRNGPAPPNHRKRCWSSRFSVLRASTLKRELQHVLRSACRNPAVCFGEVAIGSYTFAVVRREAADVITSLKDAPA